MNFNTILKSLAAGALMLVGWACTDEVEYTPTPQPAGDQVFFTEDPASVMIPQNATSLPFELKRVVTTDAVSVPVEGTATDAEGKPVEGIFTFPAEVTFAAGEDVATYNIGVDYSKVVAETDYYITLSLSGTLVSDYGATELSFTASYAPWSDWEPYSESDPLYEGVTGPPLDGEELNDTVWVCKSLINPNLEKYRFPAYLYSNLYYDYDLSVDKSRTYVINGETVYQITMPLTNSHYAASDGTIALIDLYSYLSTYRGYTEAEAQNKVIEMGAPSFYNERTGTFYVCLVGTPLEDPTLGTYGDPGYTVLQLPGFVSYSFTYNMLGNYVDTTGDESAVVQIIRSEDISSFSVGVLDGAPDEDVIKQAQDQLAANPDATMIYDASYNAVVPFKEDGEYTIYTVAYDADGNRVQANSDYYTFQAVSVKKESNWVERGVCEYTDGFMGLYKFQDQNGNPVDLGGHTWDATYEENKEIPGYYRVVNPYRTWNELIGGSPWLMSGNYYISVNCADPECCYLEYSPTGITVSENDGMIFGYSLAYNELAGGSKFEEVAELGYFGMLDAGELSFGTITMEGEVYPTICAGVENSNRLYFPESCFDFMIYFPELDKAPAHRVSAKKASAFRPGFSVARAAMATAPASVDRKSAGIKGMSKDKTHRLFGKLRPARF